MTHLHHDRFPHPNPLPIPAGGIPAESGSKAARSGVTGEGANVKSVCLI
ncbi:MAG: hypothetical protein Q8O37_05185 [Sulfuricellaceae bacterium]|nr:hypothetical protein [Sulfuricellaceae bacterium]